MAFTREQEMKLAIDAAKLLPRDLTVLRALFKRADWSTAMIPDRFQPRSLDDLTGPGLSVRSVQRAVDHLVLHGWVTREPLKAPGRQGRAIRYRLDFGRDCDCFPERPKPMTGAERARLFRERKQRQIGVTEPGIQRQKCVTYNATTTLLPAGQDGVSAEEGRDEGEGEGKPWRDAEGNYTGGPVDWGWEADSYGEDANR